LKEQTGRQSVPVYMLGWKLNGAKLEYQVVCRGEGKIVGVGKKFPNQCPKPNIADHVCRA
jgi:hypothetical protein